MIPQVWQSHEATRAPIKHKAGHRSTLAFLRFCVIAATGIRKHTQVDLLWITRRIRRISAFPSNSERLDASAFTSTLPATKRKSRTISTRATDVLFERKHCSRRRSHTQVEITSRISNSATREQSDVIAGTVPESTNANNARSTCGRLNGSRANGSSGSLDRRHSERRVSDVATARQR